MNRKQKIKSTLTPLVALVALSKMGSCSLKTLISTLLLLVSMAGCAGTPSKLELDAEVKRLCAIDGGIKVYETVNLPTDRFDKYGQIVIPSKQDVKPSDQFYYMWSIQYLKDGKPEDGIADLSRSHLQVYWTSNNKLIAESVSYTRRGGDLPGLAHPSHFSCPSESGLPALQKAAFVRN